jgi:nucleoside-diphosphate-sugar epimerase
MNNLPTKNVHVIFGTGPLGRSAAQELSQHGHRVRLVNRSGNANDLPAGTELIKGDANDPEFTRAVTQGASVVYQCAQPAYHQWAEHFPRLQQSILTGAAANGARLVIADNLYMYADTHGQPITESTPWQPHSRKGHVRAEMAQAALEAHRSGRVRVTIVRGSNFFGPHDQIMSNLVFKPALQGKTINLLGRLDQPHTFTYAPDFGRALARLGMVDDALEASMYGRTWHAPSPEALPQAEFVRLLETALGRKVRTLVAGPPMVRLLGLFNPALRETAEMMYEWTRPFRMDSSDFQRTFNVKPTPLETAIHETLEWNRRQLASGSLKTAHP